MEPKCVSGPVDPRLSVELIEGLAAEQVNDGKEAAVIDVGGGASRLASRLVTRSGFTDVTDLA